MKKILTAVVLLVSSFAFISWKGETVTATAQKFLNGLYRMDFDAAKSVATDDTRKQLDGYELMMKSVMNDSLKSELDKIRVEVKKPQITGSNATIEYRITEPADETIRTLKLVQIGGEWKVAWSKMDTVPPDTAGSMYGADTAMVPAIDEPSKKNTPSPATKKSGAGKPAQKKR